MFKFFLVVSLFSLPSFANHCGLDVPVDEAFEFSQVHNWDASFSVLVFDPDQEKTVCSYSAQGNEIVYPASTIKSLIALATLYFRDQGEFELSDQVELQQSNAKAECEIYGCDKWDNGTKHSVYDLMDAMITRSNNLATNQLIDYLGKGQINFVADRFGLENSRVYRKMYALEDPEPGVTDRNQSTANDLVQLYLSAFDERKILLSENSWAEFRDFLERQRYHSKLNRFFPEDVFFFHKTGSTSRSSSDAGYFYYGRYMVFMAGMQEAERRIGRNRIDSVNLGNMGRGILDIIQSWND